MEQLTVEEFIEKYCHNCGSQRCEGVGTEWFDGCRFKECLNEQAVRQEVIKKSNFRR